MLDAFPVPVRDLVDAALRVELIGEEPALVAELFGEESIDESDVVMHPAGFENLFAAEAEAEIPLAFRAVIVALVVILSKFAFVPTIFDVLPKLKSQPVRIDLSRMRGNGPGVMIGKVDHFRIIQRALGHDFRVPIGGPAFVHDLRLGLRREIICFFADDP